MKGPLANAFCLQRAVHWPCTRRGWPIMYDTLCHSHSALTRGILAYAHLAPFSGPDAVPVGLRLGADSADIQA
jgi:hypothetical protein